MRRACLILTLLMVTGCVETGPASGPPASVLFPPGPLAGKYSGADGGYLVTTLAAEKGSKWDQYSLSLRKIDRSIAGELWWGPANMLDRRQPDVDDGREIALVDVRRLPPGDYEIFNFDIDQNPGGRWQAKPDFSARFTISPGRTTYVGEFLAIRQMGKNLLGMAAPAGVHFVLSDRAERDIPIARRKDPNLPELTDSGFDPSAALDLQRRASVQQ
jgi:hypothetical protein